MTPISVTLDHVALDVADRARSAEFYAELLGTRVVATDDVHHLSFLRLPGSENFSDIALHEHPDLTAAYPEGQMRMAHTGWSVHDPALLVVAHEYFDAHSRVVLCADFGIALSVMGLDPDGHVVEFEWFGVGAVEEQPGFEPLDLAALRERVSRRAVEGSAHDRSPKLAMR